MEKKKASDAKYKLCLEGSVVESKYFFFDTDPKQKQELAIVFGGFEKCAPDFEIKRKTYPYYVIEIPIKGCCQLKIASSQYKLTENFIGGFPPGVPHHYKSDKQNPMEHIFIAFTGSAAKGLFDTSGLGKGGVLKINNSGEILYLAQTILKKGLEKTLHSHELCCNYLKNLLLEQAKGTCFSGHGGFVSMDTYKRCRKYIDENFSTIFLPSEAAAKCNINVRYMSRLFRKYTNISPHEYIMRLKLNKAANLLLVSNLTVKEIARMTGFADQYHFSKNFRKFHGLSPLHYRNIHL